MAAKYIIRIDDACPTMDRSKWDELERIFDTLGIKPIVAVVPNNQDSELFVDPPDKFFWDKVRGWQAKGWTIAMHGYQHVFHPIERDRLILPFHDRSEFAGLSLPEQAEKIRAALSIFEQEGIQPKVWIAPAHCFDSITLDALLQETSIRVISDGLAVKQFYDQGFMWLPQQLWELAPRKLGLWTICLHPNSMSLSLIDAFGKQVTNQFYAERITSFDEIEMVERAKSYIDKLYAHYFWSRSKFIVVVLSIRDKFRYKLL